MYKDNSQLRIEDFVFPYGKLDPENDWVKLATLVPQEVLEERYAARFVNNGYPAHPARMALDALLIQRRLKCSEQDLAAILEASVPKAATEKRDDADEGNDPPNSGTLLLDTTRCSADITYPQDIDLLNQAREKTMDALCEAAEQKKPRMYRKCARKDYLRVSKNKKRNGRAIRSAVRKQLQYIYRDMGCITELVQKGGKLSSKQADHLKYRYHCLRAAVPHV